MSHPVPQEEYVAEDLVVGGRHVHMVKERLRTMQVWSDESSGCTEDKTLDLALLTNLRIGPNQTYHDLDAVLHSLRSWSAQKFGNWTPDLGKNRHVAQPVAVEGGFAGIARTLGGCTGKSCPMMDPFAVDAPVFAESTEFTPKFTGEGGDGVGIGMLDAQVYPHPRLEGHLSEHSWRQAEAAKDRHSGQWRAWEGHGTFVADLIATAAPRATIHTQTVFGRDNGVATIWEVATALATFVGTGIQILNLSLGCRTADGQPPLAFSRAIDLLTPHVLVVAAAGNHGGTDFGRTPIWPAALPGVVAVSTPERFGPKLPWVGCTAPAKSLTAAYLNEDVVIPKALPPRLSSSETPAIGSTRRFHGFATMSGTSFAAAITSGLTASAMQVGYTAADGFQTLLDAGNVVKRYTHQLSDAAPAGSRS
jgi:membrane-anchored mycosin MYCP